MKKILFFSATFLGIYAGLAALGSGTPGLKVLTGEKTVRAAFIEEDDAFGRGDEEKKAAEEAQVPPVQQTAPAQTAAPAESNTPQTEKKTAARTERKKSNEEKGQKAASEEKEKSTVPPVSSAVDGAQDLNEKEKPEPAAKESGFTLPAKEEAGKAAGIKDADKEETSVELQEAGENEETGRKKESGELQTAGGNEEAGGKKDIGEQQKAGGNEGAGGNAAADGRETESSSKAADPENSNEGTGLFEDEGQQGQAALPVWLLCGGFLLIAAGVVRAVLLARDRK